jgi:hypothetical protein
LVKLPLTNLKFKNTPTYLISEFSGKTKCSLNGRVLQKSIDVLPIFVQNEASKKTTLN